MIMAESATSEKVPCALVLASAFAVVLRCDLMPVLGKYCEVINSVQRSMAGRIIIHSRHMWWPVLNTPHEVRLD